MKRQKHHTGKQTIRQFYGVSQQFRLQLLLSGLQTLGNVLIGVGLPYFASQTIGSVATTDGSFERNLSYLAICGGFIILCNRIGFTSLMRLQARSLSVLSQQVFSRVIHRGLRFHQNTIAGKVVSDAFDYLNAFLSISTLVFANGLPLLLTFIFGLIVILFHSIQLAGFVFIILLVTSITTFYDSRKRYELRNIRHAKTKETVAHFSDSIVNALTVKMFAAEPREQTRNRLLNEELQQLRETDWTRSGRNGNNRIAFLLVGLGGLLWLLHRLAQNDPAQVGIGIFAYTYTFMLIIRLFDLNIMTRTWEEALLAAQPMTEILGQNDEVKDADNAAELKVSKGEIRYEDVTFGYQEESDESDEHHVFKKFNLDVRPGEKVGIVGPSGGGKSTLMKILFRFEDVIQGAIKIDGQIIADVTQDSLRSQIAYVPQEPLLFHRSIRENIAYGKPDALDDEIREAARLSYALDFIETLPKGFDTVVGERGVKLSGGQRQRIAIARAILKNAPILALDEATSALDSESEVLIQEALWNLMKDKTTLVIAHRLSTIQKMDRIIVLDEGKIVEEGTHAQLVKKKNGLYARLWSHQSGGFLQDDPA